MSTIEPLRQGQEVFLKRPIQIYAKVLGPADGDLGLPPEQLRYAVELLPVEQYYLAEDLELAQWLQPKKSRHDDMSPESIEQLAQFNEVVPNLSADDPFFDLAQEINQRIARRAYERYESREFAHGHDADDWLAAESEIVLNVPADIAETEAHLTIRAGVPGFSERDVEVRVAPRSVCITGNRQTLSEHTVETSAGSTRAANRIFRVLDLPCEIDPVRVDASLGDGRLEVKLAKVGVRSRVPIRAKAASA